MALEEYRRSTDSKRLFQDANVEVLQAFYPPHVGDINDADIGDNDPTKVGAIITVRDGDIVKMAIYQGNGTWEITGGGGSIESIENDSLSFDQTSSSLNSLYPDMKIGGMVYSNTNNLVYTKKTPTRWTLESLI